MIPGVFFGDRTTAALPENRGWVVGYHAVQGPQQTSAVEIKLWQYDTPIDYGRKTYHGTEFIVVFSGVLRVTLRDDVDGVSTVQVLTLRGENREFVIIPGGVEKIVEVLAHPAFGLTVRWPSAADLSLRS